MRLLCVAPNLGTGGAERQWATLLPLLAERGVEVEVLTLDGRGPFADHLESLGIAVACAEMGTRWDAPAVGRALRRLEGGPEVVLTRGVSAQVVGHALARRYGARHVTTEHTPIDEAGKIRPFRRDQRLLIRWIAARADRVAAVSGAQIPGLVGLGYRRDRIRVIANGVTTEAVAPRRPRAETRDSLGIRDRDFLAFVGAALRPEKRVLDFVTAVERANARDRRIRGVVAGGGPSFGAFAERCRASGVVTALGPRNDVPDLLHAADVVCLTSEAEALPMILLEGMAAGRALVATDVGGVRELVVERVTGHLARVGDAEAFAEKLVQLAAHPELAARYGAAASERQRSQFTPERMTAGYLSLLQELEPRRSHAPRPLTVS